MPNLECPHFVGFEQNLGSQKFDRMSRNSPHWAPISSPEFSASVSGGSLGPALSFPRWWRCYKSRGSFPMYLVSEVQKRCNAPFPSRDKNWRQKPANPALFPVCPRGHPPGWPFISEFKPRIATVNSCFDLDGSRQHGIASNKVISWLTDHPQCRWRWPNETQIFADCETRDKGQQENPEYHVVVSIRRLRTDKNYPAEKSWLNHVQNGAAYPF